MLFPALTNGIKSVGLACSCRNSDTPGFLIYLEADCSVDSYSVIGPVSKESCFKILLLFLLKLDRQKVSRY